MRRLVKTGIPTVLATNGRRWLDDFKADLSSKPLRQKYRHREIKTALIAETFNKCVYCESKVGHLSDPLG